MRINNKKLNRVISKTLNETLEEKAKKIESKIKKNINELGGMEDEHPVFGRLNTSKMSRKEMNDLMKKHYGKENYFGDDEEETNDWEEIDIKGMDDMEDDYKDRSMYDPYYDEDEDDMDYDEEQESELDEGFDSIEMKNFRKREDYNPKEFKNLPLGKGEIGFDEEQLDDNSGVDMKRRFFNDIKREMRRKRDFDDEYGDEEFVESKGETCEQCGGGTMKEGECMECGYKMEGIYDVDDIDNEDNEFDYIEEDEDFEDDYTNDEPYDEATCKWHIENFGEDDHETIKKCKGMVKESLSKKQKKFIDKNKNKKIDAEDFKILRSKKKRKKSETKEGKKFPDLSGDGKVTRKDILMGRGVKFGKKKGKGKSGVNESVELTESELLDLIEGVILEQKSKLKSTGKPRGLQKYQQSHEKSGKENNNYLKSVAKKMKDYLKDGSKGGFDMEPKKFPMGNGELGKMKKKAYIPSDAVKDYTDNLTAAGLENLNYDEIHPSEDWVTKNIEGSSETGNNPKWANAVETDVNKKRNKIRKDNLLGNIKKKAYKRAPQPIVNDTAGEDAGSKLMMKLESKSPKETKQINEEFHRMKDLIGYNRKTQ